MTMKQKVSNFFWGTALIVPKRKTRKTSCRVLQTRVWLANILDKHNMTIELLSEIFCGGDNLQTAIGWESGTQYAYPQSVGRVDKIFKGSCEVYNLPIFVFLDEFASKKTIQSAMREYKKSNSHFKIVNKKDTLYRIVSKTNSNILEIIPQFIIEEFIEILYSLRIAEFENDSETHYNKLKRAYCILPEFCKNKMFKNFWKDIFNELRKLHDKMPMSARFLKPRICIVKKHLDTVELSPFCNTRIGSIENINCLGWELPYHEADFDSYSSTELI